MEKRLDVVVVGGGLSGLATAAYLGRAGLRAAVVEKASELGGRARTTVEGGFSLNLGAHAVYRGGAAWGVLEELSVPLPGGVPRASGAVALTDNGVHALPTGLLSLLTTGLLGLGGKVELSRVLARLGGIDTAPLVRVPAIEWIEGAATSKEARAFLKGFFRLSTYTGDLERLSAGAALAQIQHVIKHNVLYVDGGWQRLVDALRERAEAGGATFVTGDGAARVEPARASEPSGAAWRVKLHGGGELVARAVVLATGPRAAASLVPSAPALERFAREAVPIKVAALDVALARLPRPGTSFGLGTDRPTYVSVHSAVARLAPEGGAVVHALLYEPSGDAAADERELAGAIESVQPGYRAHVAHQRFLPAMVVSNDVVAAARGGLEGRPDGVVPETAGLFLAGDWVGPTGMLLDAALASAKRSAAAAAAGLAGSIARPRRAEHSGPGDRPTTRTAPEVTVA